MGIDRWLVTSMPLDGTRKLAIALPRLVLACCSAASSPPRSCCGSSSPRSTPRSPSSRQQRGQRVPRPRSSTARCSRRSPTGRPGHQPADRSSTPSGAEPINPRSDPLVQGLTTQLTTELALEQKYYQQWQCQLYGGCGRPKGTGPLAPGQRAVLPAGETQVSHAHQADPAARAVSCRRPTRLQQSRLQQAEAALPAAQAQLSAAQGEENALLEQLPGAEQRHQRAADQAGGA